MGHYERVKEIPKLKPFQASDKKGSFDLVVKKLSKEDIFSNVSRKKYVAEKEEAVDKLIEGARCEAEKVKRINVWPQNKKS